MCDLGFEVGGQVDDVDGVEGTLLGTDAATDAQAFADECDFAVRGDFDAQFAGANDWARFLAFLQHSCWYGLWIT